MRTAVISLMTCALLLGACEKGGRPWQHPAPEQASTSAEAKAAPVKDEVCEHSKAQGLREISADVDRLDAEVPQVDPDQATYFTNESRGALRAHQPERFKAMMDRPGYYAWAAHEAFAALKSELQQGLNQPSYAAAKYRILSVSQLPTAIANAKESWADYVSHGAPYLSTKDIEDADYKFAMMFGSEATYVDCYAQSLPDT